MTRFDLSFILNPVSPQPHDRPLAPAVAPVPPRRRPDLPEEVLTNIIAATQPTVPELKSLERVAPAFLRAARCTSLWRTQPVYKARLQLLQAGRAPREIGLADAFAWRMQGASSTAKNTLYWLTARAPLSRVDVSLSVLHHPQDRDIVAAAIARDPMVLAYAAVDLRANGYLVLDAVQGNGIALRYASHALRNNYDVVLAAVRNDGLALTFASNELQRNEALALEAMRTCPKLYARLDPKLRAKVALFQRALEGGFAAAYEHAPDELKSDRKELLAAVERWPRVYRYLPEWAQEDRAIVAMALSKDGLLLEDVPEPLTGDHTLVEIAVRQNGLALEYASDALADHLEIVLIAVGSNPHALPFVSERLQDSVVVAQRAFEKGAACNQATALGAYLSDALSCDLDTMMLAVKHNPYNYAFIDESLLENEDLAMAAVRDGAEIFGIIAPHLREDEEFCTIAAYFAPDVLQYCPETLRRSPSFVTEVVGRFPHALQYACPSLRDNEAVVHVAVTRDGNALQHASQRLQYDLEFVHLAIEHGATFEGLHRRWLNDPPVFARLMDQQNFDPLAALSRAGVLVRNDETIMLRALEQNPAAIEFLTVDLMLRRPALAQMFACYMKQWR